MATTPGTMSNGQRSHSQSRRAGSPPQRPTTPLRPPSRSSLRSSYTPSQNGFHPAANPISSLEPAFAELADSMADLEANFMHLQLMHESLSRFSDCFASFLYGLNVNAWCVDYPEAPTAESFRRARDNPAFMQGNDHGSPYHTRSAGFDHPLDAADQTFLTTDTSFVENPPALNTKSAAPAEARTARTPRGVSSRGDRVPSGQGQRGAKPSGLARASGRGRGRGTTRG